jgi:DNA polymerase III subunit gamma/tau
LLDQLVGYFRDAMAVAAGCRTDQMLYALPSQANDVIEVGRKLGLSTVLAIGQILDQTAARMRISVHGRVLVEMGIVRICQLGELDDLAALVAELRGTAEEDGTSRAMAPAQAAKKNGEPPRTALTRKNTTPEPVALASSAADPLQQRIDSAHSQSATEPVADAEGADASPVAADSVLAQWQRAVASGVVTHSDPPPRTSRREQLAAIADHPMVRRAMELFDVPAGQLRYTPPGGEKA